jgi:hypothetical protein
MEVAYIPHMNITSLISKKNPLKVFGQSDISEGTLEKSQKNFEGETLRFSLDRRSMNC